MHNDRHRSGPAPVLTRSPHEPIEGPFLRIARRHTICDDDAWEAVARAWEIALRHRGRVRAETSRAWMATVVANEARAVARERRRETRLPDGWETADPRDPFEAADEPDPRVIALRDALRTLPVDERRALLLFYAMSGPRRYARVMLATGWSYSKVNRALSDGRRRLRAQLLANDAPAV